MKPENVERRRAYHRTARAKELARARESKPARKEQRRWYRVLVKYGLTATDYATMLEAQGGHCALCSRTEPAGVGQFKIDHDPKTGKVRGLLCLRCNVMLGNADEDPARLRAGASYIEAHRNA